jgi:putative intracellular protease/amidase
MATTSKILITVTNTREYEKVGYRTGLWLGELTHFYDCVHQHGYEVDIASPSGVTCRSTPSALPPSTWTTRRGGATATAVS